METSFTGRVWVLGDDIDTDIIIPTEYLALKTIDDMKQYGFSPLRPELAGEIRNRRYHRCRKEFRLRFLQRAGTGDHQSAGNPVCHRQILRADLFPQFHQQRPSAHRAAGASRACEGGRRSHRCHESACGSSADNSTPSLPCRRISWIS